MDILLGFFWKHGKFITVSESGGKKAWSAFVHDIVLFIQWFIGKTANVIEA